MVRFRRVHLIFLVLFWLEPSLQLYLLWTCTFGCPDLLIAGRGSISSVIDAKKEFADSARFLIEPLLVFFASNCMASVISCFVRPMSDLTFLHHDLESVFFRFSNWVR